MSEKKFWTSKKKAAVAGVAYATAIGLLLLPRPVAAATYRKVASFNGIGFGFSGTQYAPATAVVSGSVVDSDGNPSDNATLYVFVGSGNGQPFAGAVLDQSVVTDASGQFQFDHVFNDPGNYFITISDSPELPA